MFSASACLVLSSGLPAGLRTVDLVTFFGLLEDDELVRAIVHVSRCGAKRCQAWAGLVGKFLRSNPHYAFEMIRAIAAAREELFVRGWRPELGGRDQ